MGFEPTTLGLGSRCSATELYPHRGGESTVRPRWGQPWGGVVRGGVFEVVAEEVGELAALVAVEQAVVDGAADGEDGADGDFPVDDPRTVGDSADAKENGGAAEGEDGGEAEVDTEHADRGDHDAAEGVAGHAERGEVPAEILGDAIGHGEEGAKQELRGVAGDRERFFELGILAAADGFGFFSQLGADRVERLGVRLLDERAGEILTPFENHLDADVDRLAGSDPAPADADVGLGVVGDRPGGGSSHEVGDRDLDPGRGAHRFEIALGVGGVEVHRPVNCGVVGAPPDRGGESSPGARFHRRDCAGEEG